MLNRETLYELRRTIALYPYYQPARLLMLKNLYILHDSTFDEELRNAAIYFTDRKVLFNLVEAAHYRLKRKSPQSFKTSPDRRSTIETTDEGTSRTVSLIDTFLSTMPEENQSKADTKKREERKFRKPTAADATVDYVAYLLSTDFEELNSTEEDTQMTPTANTTAMNGGELIDAFINNEGGRITLQEEPEYLPEVPIADNSDRDPEDEYLTETLAGIYIKQKRYKKALDIMNRIDASNQKKNIYFKDQKRFLEKLIANSN